MWFEMKLDGLDRKQMAAAMALAVGTVAKYEGAPGFGYEALGWRLDRDGVLRSPEIEQHGLEWVDDVLRALADAGAEAQGQLIVTLSDLSPGQADRLSAVLISKVNLLYRAFRFPEGSAFSVEGGTARLAFFEASLDAERVRAYLLFSQKLLKFAGELTRVTARERDTDNPRYAFRCFLLRLGFIGDEYKQARKLLLQRLDGDGSWRTPRAIRVAPDGQL